MPDLIRFYQEMYPLWKKGLNPKLIFSLTSKEDKTKVEFFYSEKDTIGKNGEVNTNIEITVSYPGEILKGKVGILQSMTLNSGLYPPEDYFKNLRIQLYDTLNDFNKITTGAYYCNIELYSDYTLLTSNKQEQIKVSGSFSNILIGNSSSNCNTSSSSDQYCSNYTTANGCNAYLYNDPYAGVDYTCEWTDDCCGSYTCQTGNQCS
jgi:hypothetical protein